MTLSAEVMYQALLDKDPKFEGIFITAVKTTNIFCRPTCTARKPKFINVEFFNNTESAIDKGYRPCKICRPLKEKDEVPSEIITLLDELKSNIALKIKDNDLISRGLEPHTIRRYFVKKFNMTFHAYQRNLKITLAATLIENGATIAETAYALGYESVSGFTEAFRIVKGFAPTKAKI